MNITDISSPEFENTGLTETGEERKSEQEIYVTVFLRSMECIKSFLQSSMLLFLSQVSVASYASLDYFGLALS